MSDDEIITDVTQEMVDEELHACARYGELEELEAMLASDDTNMLNFNALDKEGNCALHKAAANGHVDMLKYLVAHGCVYTKNGSGMGALTWAILNKQVEAVAYLLEAFEEIDVLEKPLHGMSPLSTSYEVDSAEIASMLLKHKSAQALDEMADKQVDADDEDEELGEETVHTTEDQEEMEQGVRDMSM